MCQAPKAAASEAAGRGRPVRGRGRPGRGRGTPGRHSAVGLSSQATALSVQRPRKARGRGRCHCPPLPPGVGQGGRRAGPGGATQQRVPVTARALALSDPPPPAACRHGALTHAPPNAQAPLPLQGWETGPVSCPPCVNGAKGCLGNSDSSQEPTPAAGHLRLRATGP